MDQEQQRAEYRVVTHQIYREPGSYTGYFHPEHLIYCSMKALHLGKGKKVNITKSKYAFFVVHSHGAIWKERELVAVGNEEIKYSQEILNVLQAVMK